MMYALLQRSLFDARTNNTFKPPALRRWYTDPSPKVLWNRNLSKYSKRSGDVERDSEGVQVGESGKSYLVCKKSGHKNRKQCRTLLVSRIQQPCWLTL